MNPTEIPAVAYKCGHCGKTSYSKNAAENCCQCIEEKCTQLAVTKHSYDNRCAKHERAHQVKVARAYVYRAEGRVKRCTEELSAAQRDLEKAVLDLDVAKGKESVTP